MPDEADLIVNGPSSAASPAVEAPAAAAVAPPVAEAAAAEPAATAAPTATEAPIASTEAPAVTVAPTEPPATTPASLLEQAGVTTEAPKPGETTPAPAATAAPLAAAPVYELTLPEGTTVVPENIEAYKTLLAEHGITPAAGQALLNKHLEATEQLANHLLQRQHDVFAETQAAWVTAVKSDEQLGGSGHQTAMQAVARMRDLLVPKDRQDAFNEMLRVTGAGNHPEFLRVLHNASRYFDEPSVPATPTTPTKTNGAKPGKAGLQAIYEKTAAARGAS